MMYEDLVGIAQIKRARLSRLDIPLNQPILLDSGTKIDTTILFLFEIMDDDYCGKSVYRIPLTDTNEIGIGRQWDYWLKVIFPMLNRLFQSLPEPLLFPFSKILWNLTNEWAGIANHIKTSIEIAIWDYCMNRYFVTGPEYVWRSYFNLGRIYFSSEDIDVMEDHSKKRAKHKIQIPSSEEKPIEYINRFKNSVTPTITLELSSDHSTNVDRLKQIRKQFPDALIDLKWNSPISKNLEEIIQLGKEYDQYKIRFVQDFPLFSLLPPIQWCDYCHHFKFSFAFSLKPGQSDSLKNWMEFSTKSHRSVYIAIDPTQLGPVELLTQLDKIDTHNGYWHRKPIQWFLDCGMIDEWNAWVGLILATLPIPTADHNLVPPFDIQKFSIFKEFCRVTHGRFPSIPFRMGFYPDLDSNKLKLVTKNVVAFKLENRFASDDDEFQSFRDQYLQ